MTETSAPVFSEPPGETQSLLVVRAFDEFCERQHNGEVLDAAAYCEQFPAIKSMLRQLVDARSFMTGSLLGDTLDDEAAVPWPECGDTFGKYHLLVELGRGAFARVFLAAEPKLGDRLVAIKIGLPGSAEANILGRIQHPNIVPVLSLDEDHATGLAAVCMPYLGGATLWHLLKHADGKPRDRAQLILEVFRVQQHPVEAPGQGVAPILANGIFEEGICYIGAQLADALAYIHERGILHLDLKPSNVLLTPDGTPMLLDFNLSTQATVTSARIGGTLPYMSPEHLAAAANDGGSPTLDARADLFSLGVLLYELVSGKLPFATGPSTGSIAELCLQMRERHRAGPVPLSIANPSVDRPIAEFIERCLAFDPAERPASATAAAQALRQNLAPQQRARRWLGRYPRVAAAGALFLGAISLLGFAAALARPSYSDRQYTAGLAAYQQGQYANSVTHFTQALSAEQKSAAAHFARGRAFLQLNTSEHTRLAMLDFEQANRLSADGRAKACLGYCLDRLGTDGSFTYYQEAIDAGFASAEIYNNLGRSHLDIGGLQTAEQHLDRAIQLNDRLPSAFHNRALLSLKKSLDHLSRLKEAVERPGVRAVLSADEMLRLQTEVSQWLAAGITDIEQAITLAPASADLHYDAGRLYAAAALVDPRHKAGALQHLKTAVDNHLDPARLTDVLLDPVRGEPAFAQMEKLHRPAAPARRNARFVDPVKDR